MSEPENRNTVAAILYRDPAVSLMSGAALLLIVLLPVAGVIFARSKDAGPLIAVLVLTGIFAAVGAAFGLVRGMRSGSAVKRRGG